jgi:transposase
LRVTCAHPDLKPGGPCPELGCRGKLYGFTTDEDVELRAAPPVQATLYVRDVLRCANCQKTFTAPLPPQAYGAKYHPSVDAVVAVMRYGLGMPHHRLEQWQRWAGVPMPTSTQYERVEALGKAVRPGFRLLQKTAANQPLLHSDDTGARILELQEENQHRGPGERTGIFTTGIVATGIERTDRSIVLYASGRRHAGENLDKLLEDRTHAEAFIHMADASSRMPRSVPRITANCLTHARRYFFEAYDAFPEHCERVLDDIATIYRHDTSAREMDPAARLVYHQHHSEPVMTALLAWIDEQFRERLVEPNGRLGKAFQYVKNHWPGLTRFLEVAGVPLDNNVAERELKPSLRHRKNSLFFKTQAGADTGDVLMSQIRTCVVNGVDPVHYLTAIGAHAAEARAAPKTWLPWTYQTTLGSLN